MSTSIAHDTPSSPDVGADVRLRVEGLSAGYGSALAISKVSLEARRGEAVAVVGANGAGKSTLLKTIVGAVPPRAGTVALEGIDITGGRPRDIVRAGAVLVPEGRLLFPDLTVVDNLRLGAVAAGKPFEEHLELVLGVFPEVDEFLGKMASTLSGGQQQMVAIGRGLMAGPKVLMVDELSLGLAPKLAARLLEALAELARTHDLAIVVVDQNVRLLRRVVERFSVLSHGQVVRSGTADSISDESTWDLYGSAARQQ